MLKAKFTWVKSVSTNVVKQVFKLTVDGVDTVTELDKDLELFEVSVDGSKHYRAELVAKGKFADSPAVVVEFDTESTAAPESPTKLVVEVA